MRDARRTGLIGPARLRGAGGDGLAHRAAITLRGVPQAYSASAPCSIVRPAMADAGSDAAPARGGAKGPVPRAQLLRLLDPSGDAVLRHIALRQGVTGLLPTVRR